MQRNNAHKQNYYSHVQWKIKYEKLQQELRRITDQKKVTEYLDAIIKLEKIEKHYDYYYEPRKLVESLIDEIEQVFTNYDKEHLINQSNEVRFCMLETSSFMHKIKRANRRLRDPQRIETECREYYSLLCNLLEKYSVELKFHDQKLHKQLTIILNKHYITPPTVMPISDFSLDQKDLNTLHQAEKAAYQVALKELRTALTQLPTTMTHIKKSGEDLIKHIESQRVDRKESSCLFKRKPFDYKRHTINLKSTTELLNSPFDHKKQDSYRTLINSNTDENKTNKIARMMGIFFLGILAFAVGLAVVALSKGAIVPVIAGSACMASGAGVMGFSAFKHKFLPTTATHLSNVAEKTEEYAKNTNNNQRCL